jgi:DNA-binding NarL/FixJ family response regulator
MKGEKHEDTRQRRGDALEMLAQGRHGLAAVAAGFGFDPKYLRRIAGEAGVYSKGQHTRASPPRVFRGREPSARNRRILGLRSQGSTLAEIGREYGLSRERVRQIVRRTEAYVAHRGSCG